MPQGPSSYLRMILAVKYTHILEFIFGPRYQEKIDICIRDDGGLCSWFPVTRAFVGVVQVGAVLYLKSVVLTCGLMFKKSNVACSGSIS